MSEKEKTIGEKLAEAWRLLPEDKRGYLVGYADGAIAASALTTQEREEEKEPA
ncbi:hypothetical protein [uncultured Oscillibacter sp.]|uniref:hypothetical protein n=1 Tax=uncultured Oscillibacter sp. TaxID=876091 RepID=UPI002609171C|nr:hypothetical protein [uncultured Oscillibacter sp.]